MIRVPETIRVTPMVWPNASVRDRFETIVNRKSGELYLGELASMLVKAGVPQEMVRRNPRSVYTPSMLEKPMEKFFTEPVVAWDSNAYKLALERVHAKFHLNKAVTPITLEAAMNRMDLTKNAGLPTLGHKCDDSEVLSRAEMCLRGKCPPPMVVFHRGKNLDEARPVQCLPFEWHLIEATYFYPLQDALLKFSNPYAAGRTRTKLAADMNQVAYDASGWLCLDYSGFDRSISGRLLGDAFRIVRENLRLTAKQHVMLDRIVTYFSTGPMLLPDGNVYSGRRHGVPSGSMFTQIIDSLVNAIAIEYLRARSGYKVLRYWVVGDDSVIAIAGTRPDIARTQVLLKELGLHLNLTKSDIVDKLSEVKFLGHWVRARAARDLEETMDHIVNPEVFSPDFHAEDQAIRFGRYSDIVRGHMKDNVFAFPYLERVLAVLEGWRSEVVPVTRVVRPFYFKSLSTRATKTDISRERWDIAYQTASRTPTNGPVLGALVFY